MGCEEVHRITIMHGRVFQKSTHSLLIFFGEVVCYGPHFEVNKVLQVGDILQPLFIIKFALIVLVNQEVRVAP